MQNNYPFRRAVIVFISLLILSSCTTKNNALTKKDSYLSEMVSLANNPAILSSTDSIVTFTGHPTYITPTEGGLLSEFGSHIGIKAVYSPLFLHTEIRSAVTLRDDRLAFFYLDISPQKLLKRSIAFTYNNWTEQADFSTFNSKATITFIDTNLILLHLSLKNLSTDKVDIKPKLVFFNNDKIKKVYLLDGDIILKKGWSNDVNLFNNIVSQEMYLGVSSNIGFTRIAKNSKGKGWFTAAFDQPEVILLPEEEKGIYYLIAFSADGISRLKEVIYGGKKFVKDSPEIGLYSSKKGYEKFLSSLPLPHTDNEWYKELYYDAVTGLKMSLYMPRNNMKHWGSIPSKGKWDNLFYLWDSGWHALGISEFDVGMAEGIMKGMFETQKINGGIGAADWDGMHGFLGLISTSVPNAGWVMRIIYERDNDKTRAQEFAKEVYKKSKRWLSWWKRNRDRDNDGLFEYLVMGESGWDQSPRGDIWGKEKGHGDSYFYTKWGGLINSERTIDFVDLNIYLFQYYKTMALWAAEINLPIKEVLYWEEESQKLISKIEQMTWDPKKGGYYDIWRDYGLRHSFVDVTTPTIWWPAFLGEGINIERARQLIERHILNKGEFFGQYPIPSVAYNEQTFLRDNANWRGFLWLVTTYSAVQSLYKYGYEDEAKEIIHRTLNMLGNQSPLRGIFEAYNPITGIRRSNAFQFGWSCAFVVEMLLERYQRERFIRMEKEISGHIKYLYNEDGDILYSVNTGSYEVPLVNISSLEDKGLKESRRIQIILSDPYHMLHKKDKITITVGKRLFDVKLGVRYEIELADNSDIIIRGIKGNT